MYTTQVALIEQFGETELLRSDRDNSGEVDATVIDSYISRAANTIDSYLRQQTGLPLSQAKIDASPLPGLAGDMVRYYLYEDGASDEVLERYKAAVSWLRDFSRGMVSLPSSDDGGSQPSDNRVHVRQAKSNTDWDKHPSTCGYGAA